MQFYSLRDKYLKKFEDEQFSVFYKECLKRIEEEKDVEALYRTLQYLLINSCLYIDMINMFNEFVSILHSNLPLTNFASFKIILKNYIEDKLNNIDYNEFNSVEYNFYKTNKIDMNGFYRDYHKSVNLKVKYKNNEIPLPNLKINWSQTYREADSIVFNNKTYTYNLFYEKKHIDGSLHFWRLNEENRWEKLSFVLNTMYDQDILDPVFVLDYFYIWIANHPGDITSKTTGSKSGYYTF